MKLFNKIEDGVAIARFKGGVYKQLGLYARGPDVFIPHSGGYLRVCSPFGEAWGTANPDIKVLELASADVIASKTSAPRYTGEGAEA